MIVSECRLRPAPDSERLAAAGEALTAQQVGALKALCAQEAMLGRTSWACSLFTPEQLQVLQRMEDVQAVVIPATSPPGCSELCCSLIRQHEGQTACFSERITRQQRLGMNIYRERERGRGRERCIF